MEKMKHFDTIVVLLIDIYINKGIKEKLTVWPIIPFRDNSGWWIL